MKSKAILFALALLMAVPLGEVRADPRREWPSPTMSNADLRKSCSAEASRVYRRGRAFRTDAAYLSKLRRDYRTECVARVKRQRSSAQVRDLGDPSSQIAGRG